MALTTESTISYISNYFSLAAQVQPRPASLRLHLFTPHVSTRAFPGTVPILKTILPEIFATRCFNNRKLRFAQEVRSTEMGHLFEHILITHLCKLEQKRFSGETFWNWHEELPGVFHITITGSTCSVAVSRLALESSVSLLTRILESRRTYRPLTLL